MGGVLIMLAASVGFLAMSKYTLPALTVFGVTLACAGIGFLDDFIKLTHRRSLGLSGRWKLLLLGVVTVGLGFAAHDLDYKTSIYIPILNVTAELSWFWYVLVFLILAGAANGVNLTDGVDGLAAGTGIIAVVCFTAINVLTYIRTGSGDPNAVDLAILGGALAGPPSGSYGSTPSPRRCSSATPVRWESAGHSPGSPSSPRSRCCSSSSAGSS